jgi:DNA gyrase subunit A
MWNNNTIEDEIQRNSLEYGVSVNTDRSIPDAKSGLKPVARRIIYDAYEKGFTSNKSHVKCASIVGDTIARFHPHGDTSVYDAMVRLSQDWVMRYPLIDFHGNNGNILGDGSAHYRYTEARLAKISEDGLLAGLKKKNVPFTLTFDEREEEPVTLPAIFPNLLCNPNEGIGWAMGCSWAPHNLNEVAQAIFDYLDGKEPMLPGPDFPTGGVIINKDDIPNIMRTGHGSVKVRGKYRIDGRNITFYEIPYGTRVESLMEEIGKACDEGTVNGVIDIRNETGRKSGLQLTIEIDKNANLKAVINQLFAKTNLQSSFSYNQVALIGKTPTELTLKDAIKVYIDHNLDCIKREAEFDLNKAQARKEIVEGLLKALEDIDNIITLIKKSESSTNAKENLIKVYNFTENQAKAIVDMKLGKLAGLERIELSNEFAELVDTINQLNTLLNDENTQKQELVNRLTEFVNKYGDARRTELTQIEANTKEEKEIANVEPEKCVVVMTESGLIKRIPSSSFRVQKRNGKGVKTVDDIVNCIIRTNTIDSLMIFTNKGRMYRILVDNIPTGTNASKGQPIKSLIEMDGDEEPTIMYSIYRDTDAKYVLFVTKNGLVKKTALEEYIKTKKKSGLAAINLKEGDSLAHVSLIKDEDLIILTKNGMGIKFNSTEIAASGRTTMGVKGISLKDGDEVITALPIRDKNDTLAIFAKNGLGKKIDLNDLTLQKRAGKGLMVYKDEIAAATLVSDEDKILVIGLTNSICISATDIPLLGRSSVGNQIIKNTQIERVSKV